MESSSASASSAIASKIGVVVVEDDPSVRKILCDWLSQAEGFVCLGNYGDGEAALAAIPHSKANVVLIDINLPGISGIECVRRLKPDFPQIQFVMLTVYEDANNIFAALEGGATGYLLKRTPREALITALREVDAGGSPMSSNIARKVVQSLQHPPVQTKTEGLSPRENEVLALLAQGYLYKEIADSIGISMPTVNTYIRRIYEKLHVHSRASRGAVCRSAPAFRLAKGAVKELSFPSVVLISKSD